MPVTTPNQPAAWRPDVTAFVADDVVPEALLLRTTTVVGSVEGDAPAVRVPIVADDGAVEVLVRLAQARRRHGRPGTLITRDLTHLLAREAPLRMMAASVLTR